MVVTLFSSYGALRHGRSILSRPKICTKPHLDKYLKFRITHRPKHLNLEEVISFLLSFMRWHHLDSTQPMVFELLLFITRQ